MAFSTFIQRGSGTVRMVLACSALNPGDSRTAAIREQFESGLQSLGAALNQTLEVHSTASLESESGGHSPGSGGHREVSEADVEELKGYAADREVFFVALLLESSAAVDEELARMVKDARGDAWYSRYRMLVDEGHRLARDLTPAIRENHPAIRVLPQLASQPLEWLLQLIFEAVTEMVTLERRTALPPDTDRDGILDETEVLFGAYPRSVGSDHERFSEALEPQPPQVDPVAVELPPVVDENVQFTVYRPRAVRPDVWYPMLAFAHLAERRPDAPADEPDPVEQVKALADQALGDQAAAYASPTSDARGGIPKESELTFVPRMEGVEFNPPWRVFRWLEDVHKEEFRLRAGAGTEGQVLRGQLTVFLGAFILADVNLVIRADESAAQPPAPADRSSRPQSPPPASPTLDTVNASPYRKIFPSYSHRDTAIVEQAERLGAALGDVYLRDRTTLRSGEQWSARLLELIDEADVFQLFWSTNSMRSEYVRQEWEHAVTLARPNFIRPTYWEEPMPHSDDPLLPPDSLGGLHFHSLVLAGTSAFDASRKVDSPGLSEPARPARQAPGPGIVVCPSCGESNSRSSVFCINCGHYLE